MNFYNSVTEIARKSTMCQERERKLNFENEINEILVLPKLDGVLERENNCGNQVAENEVKKNAASTTFLHHFHNKLQVVNCYWFKFESNTKITFLPQ